MHVIQTALVVIITEIVFRTIVSNAIVVLYYMPIYLAITMLDGFYSTAKMFPQSYGCLLFYMTCPL